MHYFITGATGIVGQQLVQQLHDQGHKIMALYRTETSIPSGLRNAENIVWVKGQLENTFAFEHCIDENTCIIHTAALVSYLPKEEKTMYNTNVVGTTTLVNLALEKKVKKFIHISSIAAIGRVKDVQTLNEETKWLDSPENSAYATSKYLGELEVWRGFEEGLNGFIINPSVILAQSDWHKSSSVIFKKMAKGSNFAPAGFINVVDVRDVVDVLLKLDNQGVNHQRFICNGHFLLYKDFLSQLAKKMQVTPPSITLSEGMLKAVCLLEKALTIFGRKPLITKQLAKSMSSIIAFDAEKIKKTAGFQFRELDNTLAWVSRFYVEKYKN